MNEIKFVSVIISELAHTVTLFQAYYFQEALHISLSSL